MTIHLITPQEHQTLLDIYKNYPNLTLQNNGYETLDKSKFTDEERENFDVVTNILKKSIKGFVEFNNFKVRKDGRIVLRFQYQWDSSFTGVGYLLLDELLNGFEKKES